MSFAGDGGRRLEDYTTIRARMYICRAYIFSVGKKTRGGGDPKSISPILLRGDIVMRGRRLWCLEHEGGGSKMENLWNKKKHKSTLLADNNTRGLKTTKQTKPRSVASAALHPIIWLMNTGGKVGFTNPNWKVNTGKMKYTNLSRAQGHESGREGSYGRVQTANNRQTAGMTKGINELCREDLTSLPDIQCAGDAVLKTVKTNILPTINTTSMVLNIAQKNPKPGHWLPRCCRSEEGNLVELAKQ